MARSTEIFGGMHGALVVKRATGDDVASLQEEARRLEAAAHPGVVELLGSRETSEGWELRLAHAGRPLELAGVLPLAEVASLVAGIAATLADLHDTGLVHGRIDASHVLIGERGRPVICGLGADPVDLTPADDVEALGALLASLLGTAVDVEPIPDRRWFGRRAWSGWERRSLLLLADQACADPPSRRPNARRFAAAIADAVPAASLAAPREPTRPAQQPSSGDGDASSGLHPDAARRRGAADEPASVRPRAATLACAVLAVVVLGSVGVGVARPNDRHAPVLMPPQGSSSPPTAPRPPHRPPTTATTTTVTPVDVEGTTVVVGDRRYQAGQPGDLVVLGDWDCVGGPTPALLRPSTGEVFVFEAWPAGEHLTVRPSARISGGDTPDVEVGPDGCATLSVRRADGTRVPVPTQPTA